MKSIETIVVRSSRLSLLLLLGLPACSSSKETPATPPPTNIKPSTADWMSMGYDNHSTYWNQGEKKLTKANVAGLDKAWEFDVQNAQVQGTPVVAGGVAYLPTAGIIAVDLGTGAELWRTTVAGAQSSLAMEGDILYVHDTRGVVHALDTKDNGNELWQLATHDGPGLVGYSSPILTKDYIIVGGSTLEELVPPAGGAIFRGFVSATKKDGTAGWKKYTVEEPEHGATLWSSVSIDEELGIVYGATGNNHGPPAGKTSDGFVALSLADGSGDFLWTQQIFEGDTWMVTVPGPDSDFGANPIIFDLDGKKLVAGGNKGGDFWVLERETGTIIKKVNLGTGSANKGGFFISGAWDGKSLLAACNSTTSTEPGSEDSPANQAAVLYALNPTDLSIVWARQVKGPVFSTITVANGVGFFGKNTTLQAFDTETGEVLKEFTTEATIASGAAISNGYVVFGSGMTWSGAVPGSKFYALKVP